MKISDSIHHNNKRFRFNNLPNSSVFPRKKSRTAVVNTASVHIKSLDLPLISTTTGSSCDSIRLEPYKPYTIGRSRRRCEFVFADRRVSKQHCQFYFDALNRRLYILDGMFSFSPVECSRVRVSLNGVFVNAVRIGRGEAVGLCAGDEVSLACGNEEGVCGFGIRIGFVVERIVFMEEVVDRNLSTHRANGESLDYAVAGSEFGALFARMNLLLSQCRQILCSDDPVSYIRKCVISYPESGTTFPCKNILNNNPGLIPGTVAKYPLSGLAELKCGAMPCIKELLPGEGLAPNQNLEAKRAGLGQSTSVISHRKNLVVSELNTDLECCNLNHKHKQGMDNAGVFLDSDIATKNPKALSVICMDTEAIPQCDNVVKDKDRDIRVPPPGNKFYLNRLQFMGNASSERDMVSLPELIFPVEGLVRVFIATFTSDILCGRV